MQATPDVPPTRRTIGLLTSGGDCAGLNAVIRAVVARAEGYGWTVRGIHQGTLGLMRRPVEFTTLDRERAGADILHRGGTILGTTNTGNPFAFPMADGHTVDRSAEVIEGVIEEIEDEAEVVEEAEEIVEEAEAPEA